jgi:hypothetical protein
MSDLMLLGRNELNLPVPPGGNLDSGLHPRLGLECNLSQTLNEREPRSMGRWVKSR